MHGKTLMGVAREGRGAIASPKMPKNTFLTRKMRQISLFFCAELCLGNLQLPFRGQECSPPKRVPHPRQIPGYAAWQRIALSLSFLVIYWL